MIVVVDASVAAMWYLPQEQSDAAVRLLGSGYELVAPTLLRLEVASALLRGLRRKELTLEQTSRTLRWMLPNAVRFAGDAERSDAPFEIAREFGGSVYDAVYIALARSLQVPLSTNDAQLCNVAKQAGVDAWMIEDGFPLANGQP